MKAGRRLDALVAENVMGWRRAPKTNPPNRHWPIAGTRTWRRPRSPLAVALPHYSTNIAAAWMVAEHVTRTRGVPLQLVCYGYARTYAKLSIDFDSNAGWSEANGEHATPLAICLAALAAMGVAA
jgi:hypothetical protein